MATITKVIETSKTALEMQILITTKVLPRPEVSVLLDKTHWEANVLHASGKLGKGTLTVEDYRVIIHIELSLFGSAARGTVEQILTEQVTRLGK